jgi:UDP-N-acetyl-D-glucosamine dehydrogenase
MRIAVIGQGYVGLPLAIAAANVGHEVTGIDLNSDLVDRLRSGESPIEDLSNEEVHLAIISNKYKVSNTFESIEDSEIIIVCVPTPLDKMHQPDFSFLITAIKSIAERITNGPLIIIESTVSPGTTRGLVAEILTNSGRAYELAYSPERIDPSNEKWKITNTPKLVAGLSDAATRKAISFYSTFIETIIKGSSPEVIETAKLLENSFRLINISFINEIAEFCWKMNIDVREVVDAAATKPYGFMPFYPSAGIGGHCIPVDPSYLAAKAQEIGAGTRFIELANTVNHSLASYFTEIARKKLGSLKNKKILLVGIAYKPNVSDVRETPAEGLVQTLSQAGAEVFWHDEIVKKWLGKESVAMSAKFDLAILVNPHAGTNLQDLGKTPILDTRGGY